CNSSPFSWQSPASHSLSRPSRLFPPTVQLIALALHSLPGPVCPKTHSARRRPAPSPSTSSPGRAPGARSTCTPPPTATVRPVASFLRSPLPTRASPRTWSLALSASSASPPARVCNKSVISVAK
ncbi:hypothetical protein DFH08DRAFT_929938, partial [Mycena albidolilacea]